MFAIKPILAIGTKDWSPAGNWGGFIFHEVAWSGDALAGDNIFDACLELNTSTDDATKDGHVPVQQRFGDADASDYRFQLATDADRPFCAPQNSRRLRRALEPWNLPDDPPLANDLYETARLRLNFAENPQADHTTEYCFDNFQYFGSELPDWSLAHTQRLAYRPIQIAQQAAPSPESSLVSVSWWKSKQDDHGRIRIDSFEEPSPQAAEQRAVQLMTEFSCPKFEPGEVVVGERSITVPGRSLVLFQRGNTVHVVRSVEKQSRDVSSAAASLDQWLTGAGAVVDKAWLTSAVKAPRPARNERSWSRLTLRHSTAQRGETGFVVNSTQDRVGAVTQFRITPPVSET